MLKPGDLVCFNFDALNEYQLKTVNKKFIGFLVSIPRMDSKLGIATVLVEDQIHPIYLKYLKKYEY